MTTTLPAREQQIVQSHAQLIILVVQSAQSGQPNPQLDEALRVSEQNGWTDLVLNIRKIRQGSRSVQLLQGLDEEDRAIIGAILRGLQDSNSLPDPNAAANPALAAPSLAHMIHYAAKGNTQAVSALGQMAEQMSHVEGDMHRLGALLKTMLDGERNPDVLCQKMGAQGKSLVLSLLEELGKLEP